LIAGLSPETVLEIGSGSDPFAYDIPSNDIWIVRSDISRNELAAGRKMASTENHGSVAQNLTCDGLRLSIKGSSISVVASINMLHHLESAERIRLYSEICRVLKNYGMYAVVEILQPHRDLKGCIIHCGLHHLVRGEKHPPFPELTEIWTQLQKRRLRVVYLEVYATWRGDYACIIAQKEVST
jgi:ubiquinone/menaquinone biosynthesis C-methylase UbiE